MGNNRSLSLTYTSNMPTEFSVLNDDLKKIQGRYSPASMLLITIFGIAVAEIIAMIVVYSFRDLPYYQQVLIDAGIMTLIIFPLLYYLSFRPILQHIRQRQKVERILKSRLRIVEFAHSHTLDELLQFTLDELESLTESKIGYFHFIEPDQTTIKLQTWSTNTLQTMCKVSSPEYHHPLDRAGVWADCVRQRRPVVHNDYASLADRRGLPEGHVPLVRDLAVPVLRDGKIVAVQGVGNKQNDYTVNDVELVSTLADFTWDIVKHKQADDAQRESEAKFHNLADWTYDWELWVGPDANIIYTSPSSERITGYRQDELMASPDLLLHIVHPEDQSEYFEHHARVHDERTGSTIMEYRVLTRDGQKRWIEHVCHPLFDKGNRYLGRRISNRDITKRKMAQFELQERNRREKHLTQMLHTMQLEIARDLHDTIGQNIGYLRMKLDYLDEKKTPYLENDLKGELKQMSQVANESYDLVRGTLAILQLKNPGDLFQLFKRYADQVVERSRLKVEFEHDGGTGELSTYQMRQLFYIFREALSNIEKYSGADQARVEISWEDGMLKLSIADNGKGFDRDRSLANGHYGLKFMRERTEMMNGSFQLTSEPGAGTRIAVAVPVEERQRVKLNLNE
jgi:PAS domain S-box-containing protein